MPWPANPSTAGSNVIDATRTTSTPRTVAAAVPYRYSRPMAHSPTREMTYGAAGEQHGLTGGGDGHHHGVSGSKPRQAPGTG
jgi:hypothetical protein